jgi:hypothetical protein
MDIDILDVYTRERLLMLAASAHVGIMGLAYLF